MLQQTTVGTVLNHFEKFVRHFPNPRTLARAKEEDVLIAWRGLGYYRRARNLKRACERIVEHHANRIPLSIEALKNIPGIGDYTANALVSIGADRRALPIDVNIGRVLARIYGIEQKSGSALNRSLKERFERGDILTDVKSHRETFEALMDIGRTFCRSSKTDCPVCPARSFCQARKKGNPQIYAATRVAPKSYTLDLLRILVRQGKTFLGEAREEGRWLSKQIEVPTFIMKSEDASLDQYPKLRTEVPSKFAAIFRTSITKYKITNYVVRMSRKELANISKKRYVSFSMDPDGERLSSTTVKILKKTRCL